MVSPTAIVNAITSCFTPGFEFGDTEHHGPIDACCLADSGGCGGRHNAAFGQRFGRGKFHLKPAAEFAFLTPNMAHLFARVS